MSGIEMAWDRVRGHERWIDVFTSVVQRGRLAHSYLFVGPAGVGKKLFANELGKALLCETASADRLQACDRCASCTMVDAGTHPDLIAVARPEDKNEFPIENMRELCRNFSLKSARGRGKVAILDDADDLNDESANCFLKTLEEPPPRSVFLLLGTSRERQIPTIVSRCQVVRFAPLPDAIVAGFLREQGITDPVLVPRLLRLAGGSPGQALALAEPELWAFRQEFLGELCKKPINPVMASKALIAFVESAGKEGVLQRRQADKVLRLLLEFLREALTCRVGGAVAESDPQELKRLQAFAEGRSPERLLELIDRCLAAETQLRRYIQPALVLEALVCAFCE